jgi:hypothetical protein
MAHDSNFPERPSGVIYPKNYVVGVIDDPQEAERAVQALQEAGFTHQDIRLFHNEEVIAHVQEAKKRRNRLQRLVAAFQQGTDEGDDIQVYVEEARLGHHILNVHAANDAQVERVRDIITTYHAHTIK